MDALTETPEIETPSLQTIDYFFHYIKQHLPKMMNFFLNILGLLIFFWIGQKLVKALRKIIRKSLKLRGTEEGVIQFLDAAIKYAGNFILIMLILSKFGITTASVVALLGSAGLTLGLGFQGSLSNLAGGVLILLLKPFKVGDYIKEMNTNLEGTVSNIDLFYTRLLTMDNKTAIIPNGMLSNGSMINVTHQEERRILLKVGISYEADLKKAKELIQALMEKTDGCRPDPDLPVYVKELGDSAVILECRCWTSVDDYWRLNYELTEKIKLAFDQAGIEIPYQKLDVQLREEAKL